MNIKHIARKYNLEEIDKKLGNNFWSPVDVAYINDWVLRAASVKGENDWHKHNDDEFFLIYKGEVIVDTENSPINLKEGEGYVVPKGVKHRTVSKDRAIVLLLEPQKVNTKGD